jgi:hypothetical protein
VRLIRLTGIKEKDALHSDQTCKLNIKIFQNFGGLSAKAGEAFSLILLEKAVGGCLIKLGKPLILLEIGETPCSFCRRE